MLSADLIERLSARAADHTARRDAPDMERLLADANVIELETPIGTVSAACGLKHGPRLEPAPTPLAAPVPARAIAEAEARLGSPLPDDLKSLYQTIADGGFGPGSGLIPIGEMVSYYEELRASPPGEGGQPWPAHLLPINRYDTCCDCYDRTTGEILLWDEEVLLEGPGDHVWERAFSRTAESLSAYLEAWLEAPSPSANPRYIKAADAGFPDSDVVIDMWTVKDLRNSIDILRQSRESLETWGLPEEGWEVELCKARGLDPEIYLEMVGRLTAEDA